MAAPVEVKEEGQPARGGGEPGGGRGHQEPAAKRLRLAGKLEGSEVTGTEGELTPGRNRKYWLLKSEPETRLVKGVDVKFGIEDLEAEEEQTTCWDGVRNYQARNFLRDEMKKGDLAFFYHSNCKEPGIAGIVEVVREGYPDSTQFHRSEPHYDPRSQQASPRWFMVDIRLVRRTKRFISLAELKRRVQQHQRGGAGGDGVGDALAGMALLSKGSRLSVQPVREDEFTAVLQLEAVAPGAEVTTPE